MAEHNATEKSPSYASDGSGATAKTDGEAKPWKVLLVDDEEQVHVVTKLLLATLEYDGRGLELVSAYSADEGMAMVKANPDAAIVLLDLAMERPDSGLHLARYIREVLGNRTVRILIRTGAAGVAPAEKLMIEYDINDYAGKSEITAHRLKIWMISALRSYNEIVAAMELSRRLQSEIEERRLAEEKLRSSEEMYSAVFNHMGVGVTMISPEMKIVFMNRVMKDWFPNVPDKDCPVCYKSFNIPPREEVCDYCPTVKTFSDGQTHIAVTDTPTENGIIHYRVISTPVKDRDGSVAAAIEVVEDITERKLVDEELRQKEVYLQGILEATDDGILAVDHSGKIIKANRRFAELWRIPQQLVDSGDDDRMLGFVLDQLSDPEGFLKKVKALYNSLEISTDVVTFKDGRMFERYTSPLIKDETVIGRIWSFRDVTENRKMEEEMLRAQKLESVGLLAGGIAHDFNNLLTAILGNISLAKVQTPMETKTHTRLQEAEKASLRARDLTQQLLTFAKGGAPIRRSASVEELIRETAAFALSGSNVLCEFRIDSDISPVEIDEGQISQVIQNLIINADQAMPVGGTLRVSCEEKLVEEGENPPLKSGSYVRISIADQGVGIPVEHLQRIFDPYFTTKEKGRGLGLASAYSIVRNHEGHISVVSSLGEGTTFDIYLPVSQALPEIKEVECEEMGRGSGRILVMDDEESILGIAEEMLSHLGYEAVCARHGKEAVEIYKRALAEGQPFKAVLCDLTIPGGLGGKEMVEILRELDRDVKVIVSSGYSNDPVMAEFGKFGFSGVITKPYRLEEISLVFNSVLR